MNAKKLAIDIYKMAMVYINSFRCIYNELNSFYAANLFIAVDFLTVTACNVELRLNLA